MYNMLQGKTYNFLMLLEMKLNMAANEWTDDKKVSIQK